MLRFTSVGCGRSLRSARERSESELRASAAGRLRPARLLRGRIVRLCNAKSGVQCGEWRVADGGCGLLARSAPAALHRASVQCEKRGAVWRMKGRGWWMRVAGPHGSCGAASCVCAMRKAGCGVANEGSRMVDAGCWPARLLWRRIVRLPNARSRAWRRGHMGRVRRYGAGQMRNCRSVLLDGAA